MRVFEFSGSLDVSATIEATDEKSARLMFDKALSGIEYGKGETGIEFYLSDTPEYLDVVEFDGGDDD